jgi:hypothetical protein
MKPMFAFFIVICLGSFASAEESCEISVSHPDAVQKELYVVKGGEIFGHYATIEQVIASAGKLNCQYPFRTCEIEYFSGSALVKENNDSEKGYVVFQPRVDRIDQILKSRIAQPEAAVSLVKKLADNRLCKTVEAGDCRVDRWDANIIVVRDGSVFSPPFKSYDTANAYIEKLQALELCK